MVTQARLKEVLDYDPVTGIFTWLVDRGGKAKAGSVAGRMVGRNYFQIRVDGRDYYAHRLAWLYVYGEFPTNHLDHMNRNPSDNRIENLRPATQAENLQNMRKLRSNTSGIIGVCWDKQSQKWRAQIKLNGRKIYLGLYNTIDEAAIARASAKAKLHTFHPEDNNEEAT